MTSWGLIPKIVVNTSDGAFSVETSDGAYTEYPIDGAWTGVWTWSQLPKPSLGSVTREGAKTSIEPRGVVTDTTERGGLFQISGDYWTIKNKPSESWSEVSVA